jgi:sigma-54 dependent transcriptional regulator
MAYPPSVAEELIDLTSALATERQLETLLGHVIDAACRITKAEAGRILTLDHTGRHLHCVVARDETGTGAETPPPIAIYGVNNTPNLSNATTYCVISGKVVNLGDIYAYTGFDFRDHYEQDRRTGMKTRAFLAVPLRGREEVTLGALQLLNPRLSPDGSIAPLPEAYERAIQSFAAHAAVAIKNARLFEENRQLIQQLDRQNAALDEENTRLRRQVGEVPRPSGIIGDSPSIKSALELVRRAANSRVAVLLLGETGTGKEMFANAIHRSSSRHDKPLIAQNCAALPESLLESELFGYKKGAFSGAVSDRAGLVFEADGGTLFLDEIGDMPLGVQAKLLRLLQEGEARRVGSDRTEHVDVRIVAATNADLPEKIAEGSFREDLYYRLSVFPIVIPPLRERPSDIPSLIDHFLTQAASQHDKGALSLTPAALEALTRWRFPGNVRELKNVIERAVLLVDAGERIDMAHLPREIGGPPMREGALPAATGANGDLRTMVRRYEAVLIEAKLREVNWNQTRAAELLSISRRSLIDKLAQYDIRPPGH